MAEALNPLALMADQKPTNPREKVAMYLAVFYIALLPLNLRLVGPVFLHDLLGPAMGSIVILRRPWRERFSLGEWFLFAFLGLGAIATACHLKGTSDLFEYAIFAYMAVIYFFFSRTSIPNPWLKRLGLGTLLAFVAYAVLAAFLGVRSVYQVYEGSSLGFMARRFFFSFDHPNLVGSFYVLPVACLLLCWRHRVREFTLRQWLVAVSVLGVLCLPLGLTVSRHMLLSIALILGFACSEFPYGRRWVPAISSVALIACFVLFYLTILFPFFPLKNTFPFFNASTFGMYTIHQVIYLKIVFTNASSALVGVGKSGLRELYPMFADWDTAYAILLQYRQEFLTTTFVTYMDAHNEFLNLATDFGIPAMVCVYAFLISGATVAASRKSSWMLPFFILGLVMVSFWDDILSKRWIWVTLGLLIQQYRPHTLPRPKKLISPTGPAMQEG